MVPVSVPRVYDVFAILLMVRFAFSLPASDYGVVSSVVWVVASQWDDEHMTFIRQTLGKGSKILRGSVPTLNSTPAGLHGLQEWVRFSKDNSPQQTSAASLMQLSWRVLRLKWLLLHSSEAPSLDSTSKSLAINLAIPLRGMEPHTICRCEFLVMFFMCF